MSLANEITNLAQRAGTEDKALRTLINGNSADLSSLTTVIKTNLVAALNEVNAAASGVIINDAATNGVDAWSSTKIAAEIATLLAAILGGAGPSDDTLAELAAQIAANAAADANLVSVASVQAFTGPQKLQGRQNIDAVSATDVGDTATDFVATFETALT